MLLFYHFPCLGLQSSIFSNIYTINLGICLLHAFVSLFYIAVPNYIMKKSKKSYLCFLNMSKASWRHLEIYIKASFFLWFYVINVCPDFKALRMGAKIASGSSMSYQLSIRLSKTLFCKTPTSGYLCIAMDMFVNIRCNCAFQQNSEKILCE